MCVCVCVHVSKCVSMAHVTVTVEAVHAGCLADEWLNREHYTVA